jgi:hypothetical protein
MVLVLLIFFSDVLYMKNICHVCSVEKLLCVAQVLLFADFCYFAREKYV